MNKHYLLLSACLLFSGAAHAQGTELFFSEYDEGAHQSNVSYGGATPSSGNERALEIYNPTTSVVNLNPYSVRRYSNGSTSVFQEEALFRSNQQHVAVGNNTMNPRSAFVIACGQATLPSIVSAANQFCADYALTPAATNKVIVGGGPIYFSGDDAMALVRYPSGTAGVGPGVIVDLIGVIGEQPLLAAGGTGGNWSGTNPIDGTGANAVYVASANQSIVRRPSVSTGLRVNPGPQNVPGSNPPVRSTAADAYNIATEWSVYSYAFPPGTTGNGSVGAQLYDQLGQHIGYTGPFGAYQTTITSTLAKFDANISVYPNPAHGFATVEIKDAKVGAVTVLNNLGQRISAQAKGAGQESLKLDVSALKPGLYFVQIVSADGQTKIYKELVVQ
ncbi:T9SS type A sorting domain-containing protein [Hymenobacter armeniacus]|uniref:T9SS type A sorting domain-containing protein n=1 Tax=Hymenobacter armeniacus TaxID=2771358 RepID=A0ABR8JU66_9BACT|nr:T9SS type A sorting domain-containing protein [Hymenobacter armeniacus]MBD2722441.1 T9SS type A sorting domain-containing protein [Hymenobacter armeniacus]